LFATHYHELTRLEGNIKGVVNYSVAVKEVGSEIVFLRKIIKGGADQSYGIEVAKLAGLPPSVIMRAKELLRTLEDKDNFNSSENVNEESSTRKRSKGAFQEAAVDKVDKGVQISFSDLDKEGFINEIKALDILSLTPMEGFNKLYELINRAKSI
jgi:DNA mismatch repair protein MutS